MRFRSEFSFIKHLRQQAEKKGSRRARGLATGIGDDAAVFRNAAGKDSVISTDMLVEHIDFRLDWSRPAEIGHKALAVSLSDIAAMGARPRWALVSLGITDKLWSGPFLDQFYRGFFALAKEHQVTLIGGDVSRTPDRVVIDSIVIGQVTSKGAVLRSRARIGDAIFVTGSLGGAAAGLRLLQAKGRKSLQRWAVPLKTLMLRQVRPDARVAWGVLLGEKQLASSMIDTSDGLSSDLRHLCDESGVGARIELSHILCDPSLSQTNFSADEVKTFALHGGEDYELLFTVPKNKLARLPMKIAGVSATCIGEIVDAAQGVQIFDGRRWKKLKPEGFAHF